MQVTIKLKLEVTFATIVLNVTHLVDFGQAHEDRLKAAGWMKGTRI